MARDNYLMVQSKACFQDNVMYHLFSSTLYLITWGEETLVVSENKMTIKYCTHNIEITEVKKIIRLGNSLLILMMSAVRMVVR